MPIKEAIANTVLPQDVPKPIPVRTISTRTIRPQPQIGNQAGPNVDPSTAASVTTEESVRLSPQLSALARKEQAYRQRELALKQREKDLEAKLAKSDQFDSLSTKLGAKDYSEAEKLGLDYEGYTKYLLDKQAGEDPQTQKFKALEAEIQALKKSQEDKDSALYEDTVGEYKTEIASAVSSNPEFSSIKELKAEGHVLQLILDSFEEDKIEMSVEEACKEIENALIEQGKKFSSLPKLKTATSEEEARRLPPPKPTRTLSNNMQPTATPAIAPRKSYQHMSESERYAEARRVVLARRQQQQGS
jgi:hypothetical protein